MKGAKILRAIAEKAGVQVERLIGVESSSHVKVVCLYGGYRFFILVGGNFADADARVLKNILADFKKARRAIETKDPALMRKYLGARWKNKAL